MDLPSDAMTIGAMRRGMTVELQKAGVESPGLVAHMLLCYALALDGATLVAESRRLVPRDKQALIDRWVARAIAREPVTRIIGWREFWSHSFRIGPDTLDPRPETETVVEAALEIFPERDRKLRVLDLGTGAGILLAAILLERPNATGIGMDRSMPALQVARENLDALDVGNRASFVCGDWSAALDQRFDLIVANPPYIASKDIPLLAREVKEHDPRAALDGGADGLEAYRKIIAELPQLISEDGAAVLELGIGQEDEVTALVRARGLEVRGPARRDLGNVPRALIVYPPKRK